jgi:hypothetical protein
MGDIDQGLACGRDLGRILSMGSVELIVEQEVEALQVDGQPEVVGVGVGPASGGQVLHS